MEIRYLIYDELVENSETADISIRVRKRRTQHNFNRFKYLFPSSVSRLSGLLDTCQYINAKINEYIGKKCAFVSQHSTSFATLPATFGLDNCALIQRFSLKMDFLTKIKHEGDGHWPALLQTMIQYLPSLEWFELYSEWPSQNGAFPTIESGDPADLINNGTNTRYDQEKRATIRFLAWLVLRHAGLDRLMAPATSINNIQEEQWKAKQSMLASKYQGEDVRHTWNPIQRAQNQKPTALEFHVLNTKLIRRVKWSDLCAQPIRTFIIAPGPGMSNDNIPTSEVGDADDRFFGRLDARGYQPFSTFKANGWIRDGPITVDRMIDAARRYKEIVQERASSGGARRGQVGCGGSRRGRGVKRGSNTDGT